MIAALLAALVLHSNTALAADGRPEVRRLAVLEFEVSPAAKVDRLYFSDRVRGAISRLAPQLFVMTRESEEALLQAQGKGLADCEGECAVETGRQLGADYVVSGRFAVVGKRVVLSLRIHATADGRMVAADEAAGETPDQLAEAVLQAASALLPQVARGDPAVVLLGGPPVEVDFASEPPGAVVLVDEVPICQSTPCTAQVRTGQHRITLRKDGHTPAAQVAAVQNGLKLSLVLAREEGRLTIDSESSGVQVQLDGRPAGRTPVTLEGVLATGHVLSVDDPCFERLVQQVEVRKGETRVVRLAARPREAELRLSATDEDGAALTGTAYVDGKVLPVVAGAHMIPLCARAIRVESGGARVDRRLELSPSASTAIVLRVPVARCAQATSRGRLARWAAWGGLALGAGGLAGALLMKSAVNGAPPGDPGLDSKIASGRGLNVIGLVGLGALLAGGTAWFLLPAPVDACAEVLP